MTLETPRALVIVNGTALTPKSADVQMSKTQKSDTFQADIPFGALPTGMNEGWWSTANNITAQVQATADSISGYVQIFDGMVDKVDFDFTSRVLSISGRDKSAALIDATSTEKFNNQDPDQIVQVLAGRHGISADTDSIGSKAGKIFQFDYAKLTQRESEWTVIQRLADHFGMVCYATGGKLYWKTYPEQLPTLSLIYSPPSPESPANASFISLKGSRNVILGRPVKVSVKTWNHKEKKLYQSEQTEPGSGDTLTYNYQGPGMTGDQVERIAKKRLAENTSHELGFDLEMPGDPTVTPRFMLELSGTGTAFDQQHEIKTVEHRISFEEGYLMTISAKSKSGKRAK